MDAISYSYADKQAKRIKKFIDNPDSNSGIVTVPKVIGAGEHVTVPAGRVAVLPNVQVDGTLNVEGEVFIPAGTTLDKVVEVTGNQNIDGIKTFSSSPIVPTPTTGTQAVNKSYVDGLNSTNVKQSANLSDLTNAGTARTNLGLGTAATKDVGQSQGNVMQVGAFGIGGVTDVLSGTHVSNGYVVTQTPSLGSDYPIGLLIKTAIRGDLSAGASFLLTLTGKGYADSNPHNIMLEGYFYNGQIINAKGINLTGTSIRQIHAFVFENRLCFWVPPAMYWNSFYATVQNTLGGDPINYATELLSSVKPSGIIKEVLVVLTRVHHTGNTTVDPNGFIKAASPIVNLYRDRAESNGFAELEEMQFERIATGHYRLTGVPEFSRDGWYIETPKDRNGNVYFTLDYVESKNTLEILTYTPDYSTGRTENGAPVDIIDGRFVSLRFAASPETIQPEEA